MQKPALWYFNTISTLPAIRYIQPMTTIDKTVLSSEDLQNLNLIIQTWGAETELLRQDIKIYDLAAVEARSEAIFLLNSGEQIAIKTFGNWEIRRADGSTYEKGRGWKSLFGS
jgi:hypothetical protein